MRILTIEKKTVKVIIVNPIATVPTLINKMIGGTEVEVELKKGRSNHKKKYFRRLKGL